MRASLLLALACPFVSLLTGCDDPCASGAAPTVEIGQLVGTAGFEAFADGEEVMLGFAPQGGSGVVATLRTTHMSAHENLVIFARTVRTHLTVDGPDAAGNPEVLGDFELSPNVYCVDGEFGLVTNAIFGLDPGRFDSPESVAGRAVTLSVDVEDDQGARASATANVVFASEP